MDSAADSCLSRQPAGVPGGRRRGDASTQTIQATRATPAPTPRTSGHGDDVDDGRAAFAGAATAPPVDEGDATAEESGEPDDALEADADAAAGGVGAVPGGTPTTPGAVGVPVWAGCGVAAWVVDGGGVGGLSGDSGKGPERTTTSSAARRTASLARLTASSIPAGTPAVRQRRRRPPAASATAPRIASAAPAGAPPAPVSGTGTAAAAGVKDFEPLLPKKPLLGT